MQPTNPTNDKVSKVRPDIVDFAKKYGCEVTGHSYSWHNFNYYELIHKGDDPYETLSYMVLENIETGNIRMSTFKETFAIMDKVGSACDNWTNIDQAKQLVKRDWPTATTEKREKLIKLMMAFESPEWSEYLSAAEKNQIAGSDILIKHEYDLINAAARGTTYKKYMITKLHRMIITDFSTQYYQRQVDTLLNYLK